MAEHSEIGDIPRGNTAPGVSRWVMEHLLSSLRGQGNIRVLDIPCGNGEFLDALKRAMPHAETIGADLHIPVDSRGHTFHQVDAGHAFAIAEDAKFDAITCISGVMEFDNTLYFFEQIRTLVTQQGRFLVTNDNLLTARDRLLYFLFGRFRQFKYSTRSDVPTWKIIPLQNLIRILSDASFRVERIAYVRPRRAEWLWLPLAMPIYLAQYAYMRLANADVEKTEMRDMFSFASLLSRHYILVCRPKP